MKLVQVDYRQPFYRGFPVVVEVPEDYPEEKVAELLAGQDLSALSAGGEEYSIDEPPECLDTNVISPDDGYPHFQLVDGILRKIGG